MEHLILSDGTKIDTATGKVFKDTKPSSFVRVPTNAQAVEEITRVRMRMIDMPVPPAQMHGVAVIVAYTLMGLSDQDIMLALRLTESQLGRIKMSDAYAMAKKTVIDGILADDTEDVRMMFAQHAKTAALNIQAIAASSDEKVALKANQDILDRAGHRPADTILHKVEGGLRIEYIDKKPLPEDIVTIEHGETDV